jgi:uncharacterized lipoprotein YbaY
MRSRFLISLLLSLSACLIVAGCGGEKERAPETQTSEAPSAKKGATPGGGPGPGVSAPITTPDKIAGGWMRDVPAEGFAGREGFQLDPDGTLHLVGIYTMNGLAWQLKGDMMEFLCNTERYPEPQMSKLSLLSSTASVLSVESTDYFTGTYERAELRRVTGTVAYRERISLSSEAVVRVSIRDRDERDTLIGQRLIYLAGQVPIQFSVVYDPSLVDETHHYEVRAEIVDNGRLAFVTSDTYPVITQGAPSKVDMVVRGAASGP